MVNNLKIYTVETGKHDFKPVDSFGLICPTKKRVTFLVQFDKNCNYVLPGEDQQDWNKGGGFSFSLFSNLKSSAMWGWRFSPKYGVMEFCAYWHKNGKALYPELTGQKPFLAALGESVKVEVYKVNTVWYVEFSNVYGDVETFETTAKGFPVRPIGLYFGGTLPAPKPMTAKISRN